MRIGNVQDGYISLADPKYIQKSHKPFEKFILSTGDILVSLTGNVGRVGVIAENHLPAVINQRVARITPRADFSIQKDLLFYFFRSSYFIKELIGAGHGAAQQNISTKDIENLIIPLPPLPEQKRIVKILDEAFEKIEKAMKTLKLSEEILVKKCKVAGKPVIVTFVGKFEKLQVICLDLSRRKYEQRAAE